MGRFYLDTNPLMRWAEAQAASAAERSKIAAARLEAILASGDTVALSEVTFIEFHDNISAYLRNNQPGDHDDAWFGQVQDRVMGWISAGELVVLAPFPRMFDTAMSYISLAQAQGRALRTWDAVHLCRATEWARETADQVTIVTGDGDFGEFLELFPQFQQFVAVEVVGVAV